MKKTEMNTPVTAKYSLKTVILIVIICLLPMGLPALLLYLIIRAIVRRFR